MQFLHIKIIFSHSVFLIRNPWPAQCSPRFKHSDRAYRFTYADENAYWIVADL